MTHIRRSTFRAVCPHCRRPDAVCYCAKLERIETRTRLVFLQHPRERRMPVSTARMAHLSLPNSELHEGLDFEHHPRITALAREPGTCLLFPGPGAMNPIELADPPRTVIVVDGTWSLAKKLLRVNPTLQRLPRLGFVPRRPSNYRIRREPAEHCVSTIEAAVELLGVLDGEPERFDRLLGAFTYMVDRQLEFANGRERAVRHRHTKAVGRRTRGDQLRILASELHRAVTVYAEVNAHPRGTGFDGPGELVQLVAERIATRETFSVMVAPRRPLAPGTPQHLAVNGEALLSGEVVTAALHRFRAFMRENEVACVWGPFTLDVLRREGVFLSEARDLRLLSAMALRARPAGMEQAAERLAAPVAPPFAPGRAGARIAALSAVARGLSRFA